MMLFVFSSCAKDKADCAFKSKYVYETIVFDEACDCIVAGKVKYLKDCKTAILLDYGNGECDNIAIKTICQNGDCETSAGAYTEVFEIDCQQTVIDGPISEEEALKIGL